MTRNRVEGPQEEKMFSYKLFFFHNQSVLFHNCLLHVTVSEHLNNKCRTSSAPEHKGHFYVRMSVHLI